MVILNKKRVMLLERIANKRKWVCVRDLSKGIYSCDASCFKVLNEFVENGIIYLEKNGRRTERKLTEKGKEIYKLVATIMKLLN